jgi:hypothetical protein
MANSGPVEDDFSGLDALRPKKKRPKAIVRPRMFRGFTGTLKHSMALLQAFATLFKLITKSPKNREFGFQICLQDEISHIAIVCQNSPQVLEYILWIIDSMYQERVKLDDFEESMISDEYSMQLSTISGSSVYSKTRKSSLAKNYATVQQAHQMAASHGGTPHHHQHHQHGDHSHPHSRSQTAVAEAALNPNAVAALMADETVDNNPQRVQEALQAEPVRAASAHTNNSLTPSKIIAEANHEGDDDDDEKEDRDDFPALDDTNKPSQEMTRSRAGLPENLEGLEWDVMSDVTAPTVASLQTLDTPQLALDISNAPVVAPEELTELQKKQLLIRQRMEEKEEKEAEESGQLFEGGTVSVVFEDKKQISKRIATQKVNDKERRRTERMMQQQIQAGVAAASGKVDALAPVPAPVPVIANSRPTITKVGGFGLGTTSNNNSRPSSSAANNASGRPASNNSNARPTSAKSVNTAHSGSGIAHDEEDSNHPRRALMSQPHEIVIVAVSMIGAHTEIGPKEKQVSARWLSIWDDGSYEYQLKVRLGMSLSSV